MIPSEKRHLTNTKFSTHSDFVCLVKKTVKNESSGNYCQNPSKTRLCGSFRRHLLQRLKVLNDLHSFLFGQLAADYAVTLWAVFEFMPCIRIACQIGAKLTGTFERFRV